MSRIPTNGLHGTPEAVCHLREEIMLLSRNERVDGNGCGQQSLNICVMHIKTRNITQAIAVF
jgi:hypothetical protein